MPATPSAISRHHSRSSKRGPAGRAGTFELAVDEQTLDLNAQAFRRRPFLRSPAPPGIPAQRRPRTGGSFAVADVGAREARFSVLDVVALRRIARSSKRIPFRSPFDGPLQPERRGVACSCGAAGGRTWRVALSAAACSRTGTFHRPLRRRLSRLHGRSFGHAATAWRDKVAHRRTARAAPMTALQRHPSVEREHFPPTRRAS